MILTHHHPALQFAKLSGFSPIIATASAHNTALVKEYGATHVIDRTLPTDKIVEEVTAIAGGPIDLVYDAVSSGDTPTIATGALRHGGQVVFVIPYQADALEKLKAEKAAQTIFAEGIMSYRRNQGAIPGLLQKLPELLEKGILKVRVSATTLRRCSRPDNLVTRIAHSLRDSAWWLQGRRERFGETQEWASERGEVGRTPSGYRGMSSQDFARCCTLSEAHRKHVYITRRERRKSTGNTMDWSRSTRNVGAIEV